MHNIFNGHATTTATTHRQPKQRLPKGNATPEMAMHNIKLRLTCQTAATPRQQTWTACRGSNKQQPYTKRRIHIMQRYEEKIIL